MGVRIKRKDINTQHTNDKQGRELAMGITVGLQQITESYIPSNNINKPTKNNKETRGRHIRRRERG